jgi:predicted nucleic acid-binding protein
VIIVDTNVLVDVLEDDAAWVDWSVTRLRELSKIHELVITPIIYAELSLAFDAVEDLNEAVAGMELRFLEIPRPALFLAGKAFIRYRRRGGTKTNVLSDFLIGAHAAVLTCPILTRDTSRYAGYFPSVKLFAPDLGEGS